MMAVLLMWCLIAGVAAGCGRQVLLWMGADTIFEDTVDRVVVEIWLGLGIIASSLLLVGHFTGITPWYTLPFVVGGLISTNRALRRHTGPKPYFEVAPYAIVTVALAFHAAVTRVDAYDTALYHQQAVWWLSHFGIVRGIAWFNVRLGWSSSWFALAASLDWGTLAGRVSPVLGGFVTACSVLHWMAKLKRLAAGKLRPCDWYLLAAYPLLLAAAWKWHYEISLGADLPTWILTVLAVWTAYLCLRGEIAPKALWLPYLLASIGCSFKFSVLPLLAATAVFAILAARRFGRPPLALGALCCIPVGLTLSANVLTSGCPLYPSAIACAPTHWTVPFAKDVQSGTTEFARRWLRSRSTNKEKAALLILVLGGAMLALFRPKITPGWYIPWGLCAGAAGLGMLLWGAPNPRFGLGFVAIFPALGLLAAAQSLPAGSGRWVGRSTLVSALLLAGLLVAGRPWELRELAPVRWLTPTTMAGPGAHVHIFNRDHEYWDALSVRSASIGEFHFVMPVSTDQCWNVRDYCSPLLQDPHFQLQDPRRGARAGFVRAPGTESVERPGTRLRPSN